ncbi:MAG: hypothetical protein AAF639_43660 [Chloroflexota bacterium]
MSKLISERNPLSIPEDFNPETNMLAKTTEYGTFHETRKAAQFAAQLVENGTEDDLALAEKVLEAVLDCQEREPFAPHMGNFYWMREDSTVEDLNAMQFVLESLIPMMIQHNDRVANISSDLHGRLLESIHLALEEISRLNVWVAYTNIAMLDILNTCLGGELLGNPSLAERGYKKMLEWIIFTNRSGHPLEYNSPTYTAVTLRALKRLRDLIEHEPTRQRARTMTARLALSVALHIHGGTGRWAGPFSRAYQPSVVGEINPEIEMVRQWVADDIVPDWVGDILDASISGTIYPLQITETASKDLKLSFTTYQTSKYALGVATQSFQPQSNVCLLQYTRPNAHIGIFYTRYIIDDKWFGDSYHATDRTKTRNLLDEGDFFGVQQKNRAIGVYAPSGSMTSCQSAKAAFIWTQMDQLDDLWVNDQHVDNLPNGQLTLPEEPTIVISSGDVYMAVRPLVHTRLGKEIPIQLVARDGDLVLEVFNYQGTPKNFWELRWPGAFYQGRPICAFYIEVAARSDYEDGLAFSQAIRAGHFTEEVGQPFTYTGEGQRIARFSYKRDGEQLGLDVDLMAWVLKYRWTDDGLLDWPMLNATVAGQTVARQSADGIVRMESASLTCADGPAWLLAMPKQDLWVAGYTGIEPTILNLKTPAGTRRLSEMEMGTIVVRG